MCGGGADQIETFRDHIENEHCMWDYLRFAMYLREKDPADYTAVERYVNEQLDQDSFEWVPTVGAPLKTKWDKKYDPNFKNRDIEEEKQRSNYNNK